MKKTLHLIAFLLFSFQLIHAQNQEDGVTSFSLPIRNSLKFNRFILNPTFSFVKEQSSTFALYSKSQWVQFENAPQTYLFTYSGRLKENEGIGLALFQQNLGVFTTFGGVANFAHNVVFQEDSNLTFGLNVGFYKSGLNNNAVILNGLDPALENIPSSSLITVNPGINYGTKSINVGVSANNVVLYNLNTSKIVKEDPEKNIQAHVMYTGYFDKSKFSAIVRTEVKKPKTVISGLMMYTLSQGIWAQLGYSTLYGASGGLGMNLTKNISMEYNYEKGLGNFSNFGASHEITIAYRFNRSEYANEDEEGYVLHPAYVKVTESEEKSVSTEKKEKRVKEPKFKFKEIKLPKRNPNQKAKEISSQKINDLNTSKKTEIKKVEPPVEVKTYSKPEDELSKLLRESREKQEKLLNDVKETVKEKSDKLDVK